MIRCVGTFLSYYIVNQHKVFLTLPLACLFQGSGAASDGAPALARQRGAGAVSSKLSGEHPLLHDMSFFISMQHENRAALQELARLQGGRVLARPPCEEGEHILVLCDASAKEELMRLRRKCGLVSFVTTEWLLDVTARQQKLPLADYQV